MSKKNPTLQDTGERMIPEFHKGALIYAEHYIRYLCAENIIKGKVVLDIACGSGYGTKLMAKHAKQVIGVDVDEDTVAYASQHFAAPNILYKVGDGEHIPLEDHSVDVVITFETIEHIPNYKQFVKELKRVLKSDGTAIVSTPNDPEFAEGNHFHLHEFEYDELVTMLKKDFTYIDSYFQATSKYVALGKSDIFNKEGTVQVKTLNLAPTEPKEYLYFYLVCSNKKITETIEPVAAVGAHYSDRQNDIAYRRALSLEKSCVELQEQNAKLAEKLKIAAVHNRNLETTLNEVTSSQAYRVGTKLASFKRHVLPR